MQGRPTKSASIQRSKIYKQQFVLFDLLIAVQKLLTMVLDVNKGMVVTIVLTYLLSISLMKMFQREYLCFVVR